MEFIIKFGNTKVKLIGKDEFIGNIKKELSLFIEKDNNYDLVCNIISSKDSFNYDYDNFYVFEKNKPKKDPWRISYQLMIPKKNVTPFIFYMIVDEKTFSFEPTSFKDYIGESVWRIVENTWMSRKDALNYEIISQIIESICLLYKPDECPLVHSAGMRLNGKGVLISGEGGVGKTTTSLQLILSEKDCLFINDDVALLEKNGDLCFYPRKIMIYRYNIKGFSPLKLNLVRNQSVLDRLHWMLHNFDNLFWRARRRISAENLFGRDKVSYEKTSLNYIFFLERTVKNKIEYQEMSNDEFSNRMARIMIEEKKPFSLFLFEKTNINRDYWIRKYCDSLLMRLEKQNTKIIKISIPSNVEYKCIANLIKKITK